MNLELIKNNIIFRLITKKEFDRLTKQSEATKDEFPYRKWNDLYLIYRSILPNQSEDLVTTMLISNFIMKRLKFTEEELFQFAKTNTAKRTGIIVKPLSNPFSDIFDFCNEMSAKTDIWNFSDDTSDSTILSNKNYMNGAALILCDEVMDKNDVSIFLQLVIFIVSSTVLVLLTRPIAEKYVNGKTKRTNIDRLIGQTAIVKETINNKKEQGLVRINGMDWTARAEEIDEVILKGKPVEILDIQGIKLIVRKKK